MENNGKGIFYGVIGVATLIVAIIGATFAYFTATATNDKTISGTAAQAGLELTVTPKSANMEKPMVPQLSTTIQTAVTGTDSKSCVDGNGNTVCKVYEVVVKNTGTATAVVNGTFTLTATTMANLKWGKSTTSATTGFSAGATYAKTETDIVDPATPAAQTYSLAPAGQSGDTETFWIVVYIDETKGNQNDTDKGSFTGTITFNSADGSGVTSTFTSAS